MAGTLVGGYWLRRPGPNAEAVVAYTGAVAPVAVEAVSIIGENWRDVGLLAVTSADRLYAGWHEAQRASQLRLDRVDSHIEWLLWAALGQLQSRDGAGRASLDVGSAASMAIGHVRSASRASAKPARLPTCTMRRG